MSRLKVAVAATCAVASLAIGVSVNAAFKDGHELLEAGDAYMDSMSGDAKRSMDNNAVESLARPIALSRKNALFAGHDEGAAAWGRIASLIETAKLHQIEPYAWPKDTLEKIAAGHPNSRIVELLPLHFKPPSS